MKNDTVLKVEGLGKYFKSYSNPMWRVAEWLTFGYRTFHKEYHALRDISFEVKKGGFLGIIGPNGAGKSTLLKVLTGVMEQTSGDVKISGRVLSLLEINGGMDNDLSGRENIVRSAQLLGFPPGHVEEKMDQIAEFAELADFFEQPLAVYSSGMRIRLAFSMFAFLECDILILDEILAVGDIFFRQKCYARLEELIKKNTSIILVTHSTGTVRQYCDDVILLQNGQIAYHGSSDIAIQKYFEIKKDQGVTIKASDTYVEEDYVSLDNIQPDSKEADVLRWPSTDFFAKSILPQKSENQLVKLSQLLVCDEQGKPTKSFEQGATVVFYYAYQMRTNIGVPVVELTLLTPKNLIVHTKNSLQSGASDPLVVRSGDLLRYKQTMKLDLAPGNYIFNLRLFSMHPGEFEHRKELSIVDLQEKLVPVIDIRSVGVIGVSQFHRNQGIGLHGGLCNLDGEMHLQVVRSQ